MGRGGVVVVVVGGVGAKIDLFFGRGGGARGEGVQI